jgi:TetR/AcrR family mexXY operon transcriptional repressor
MARKTKIETEKTISNILDAAEVIFIRKGVAHTTVADLALQAGVSRGAVYGHFEDKTEVCLAMCARALASTAKILERQPGEDALATLQRWGMKYLQVVHSPGSIRNALEILYLKCEQSPEFQPLIKMRQVWEAKTQRTTARLLKEAQERGELPRELDVEMANGYLQCLLAGVSTALWYAEKRDETCWPWVEKLLSVGIESVQTSAQFKRFTG